MRTDGRTDRRADGPVGGPRLGFLTESGREAASRAPTACPPVTTRFAGARSDRPPVISGLSPDPRRAGAVLVEIDGTRFGAVAREVAADERLAPGLVVGPELHHRLLVAADAEAAFRTVLRALERRAYARADLVRRLVRKGHPRAAAEAAVERAAAGGLVDDQAFTLDYVQTRAARGRGPSRLVRDLLAMGVERSLVDRTIAAQLPDGATEDMILALATKRAQQLAGLPRPVRRRRLLAFLTRRGFGGAQALALVRRLTERSPAA